jgi:hypothetical protein
VVASNEGKNPMSWSADGRFLLYRNTDPQTGNDLWVVPLAGDPYAVGVFEDAEPRSPRRVFP